MSFEVEGETPAEVKQQPLQGSELSARLEFWSDGISISHELASEVNFNT